MRLIPSPLVAIHSRRTSRSFASASQVCSPLIALNGNNLESVFIKCLVYAGSGHRNRRKRQPYQAVIPSTKRATCVQSAWSYIRLPLLIREDIQTIGMPLSRRRLLGVVDYYDTPGQEDDHNKITPKINASYQGIRHIQGFDVHKKRAMAIAELAMHHQQAVMEIENDIESMIELAHTTAEPAISQEANISIERLFQKYRGLPGGRIAFFNEPTRQGLMELLIAAARRNSHTTLKFLSVLDELQHANLPIPQAMCNAAIHLVGKSLGRVNSRGAEASLRRWMLMEASLGFQGDIYTFNILLDVAVKGEQYALAEMILDEMKQRGIKPDRVTRIGLIYFYGVRGDGDGIRRTYRELINEDMIVDTVVLNCVIASLLRAGEVEAADHVYSRMKDFAATTERREVRHVSEKSARAIQRLLKGADAKDARLLQQLQDISPDTKTFIIFVEYHISNTGDLDRIAQYLDDMQALRIAPTGKIFVDLFRGFFHHGGARFTWWTAEKLEKVWNSFQQLVEQEQSHVYWGKWVVIWMLRAYARCCGRDLALQKWSYIKARWSHAEEHEPLMLSVIHYAVPKSTFNTR